MNLALFYLLQQFIYRILQFFEHWYLDGSKYLGHKYLNTLESLDYSFAVKVTISHFFEPLYGDYSVIGRILGVIFRSLRTILGLAIYAALTIIFISLALVWYFIPPTLLFYAIFKP